MEDDEQVEHVDDAVVVQVGITARTGTGAPVSDDDQQVKYINHSVISQVTVDGWVDDDDIIIIADTAVDDDLVGVHLVAVETVAHRVEVFMDPSPPPENYPLLASSSTHGRDWPLFQ